MFAAQHTVWSYRVTLGDVSCRIHALGRRFRQVCLTMLSCTTQRAALAIAQQYWTGEADHLSPHDFLSVETHSPLTREEAFTAGDQIPPVSCQFL
jgi:hypothetical protein